MITSQSLSCGVTFRYVTLPYTSVFLELKGPRTSDIRLVDSELCISAGSIVSGDEVAADAVTK